MNHMCLPRLVQVLKNSLLFVSSDLNKIVLIVDRNVPLPNDLLQSICVLLNSKIVPRAVLKMILALDRFPVFLK